MYIIFYCLACLPPTSTFSFHKHLIIAPHNMCVYSKSIVRYKECLLPDDGDHIERMNMRLPRPIPGMDEDTKKQINCDEERLPTTGLCASAIEWQAFRVSGSNWAGGRCPFCEEEGRYQREQSSEAINMMISKTFGLFTSYRTSPTTTLRWMRKEAWKYVTPRIDTVGLGAMRASSVYVGGKGIFWDTLAVTAGGLMYKFTHQTYFGFARLFKLSIC